MIVFYIITCILCIALVYITKCCTTVYVNKRRDTYSYWYNHQWVNKGKAKFPRWYIILSIVLSFVPVLNVFLFIGAIANYIVVNKEPPGAYTDKLTITKVSLDRVNTWVSWLFEKV